MPSSSSKKKAKLSGLAAVMADLSVTLDRAGLPAVDSISYDESAAMPVNYRFDNPVMAGEGCACLIRIALPKLSAALYIGKEEGHRAGWQVRHRTPIAALFIRPAIILSARVALYVTVYHRPISVALE